MQIIRRSSKKRRFPVQMLRRLLRECMPRRLRKTHHFGSGEFFSSSFFCWGSGEVKGHLSRGFHFLDFKSFWVRWIFSSSFSFAGVSWRWMDGWGVKLPALTSEINNWSSQPLYQLLQVDKTVLSTGISTSISLVPFYFVPNVSWCTTGHWETIQGTFDRRSFFIVSSLNNGWWTTVKVC